MLCVICYMNMSKSPIVTAVKKVIPAVVKIVISKDVPKIRRYFLEPFGSWGWAIPQDRVEGVEKVKIGGGSGFIVEANGIILTNKHVVSHPDADYTVFLGSGKEYQAKVLARDPINDVAIIQIDAKGLPTVELGDSSKLELGETLIAIGNALGQFQNTVSTGVVSGLSRFITASDGYSGQTNELRGLIQTDAAINPGNSGGPLVNIEGRAIGINAAVVMGAENIGFALPINTARKALEDLKKYGRIIQPSLGVRYFPVNKQFQEQNNLPVDYGALIIPGEVPGEVGVVPGSSAQKAGLREYDIILECDKTKITPENSLSGLIAQKKVGDLVLLKVLRQNKMGEVKVKLEERR